MKKNYYALLDKILSTLKHSTENEFKTFIKLVIDWHQVEIFGEQNGFNKDEIYEAYKKLERNGYVYTDKQTELKRLTFEGYLFEASGGYAALHLKRRISKILKQVNILVLALGAIAAVVITCFAIIDRLDRHHQEQFMHKTQSMCKD